MSRYERRGLEFQVRPRSVNLRDTVFRYMFPLDSYQSTSPPSKEIQLVWRFSLSLFIWTWQQQQINTPSFRLHMAKNGGKKSHLKRPSFRPESSSDKAKGAGATSGPKSPVAGVLARICTVAAAFGY